MPCSLVVCMAWNQARSRPYSSSPSPMSRYTEFIAALSRCKASPSNKYCPLLMRISLSSSAARRTFLNLTK